MANRAEDSPRGPERSESEQNIIGQNTGSRGEGSMLKARAGWSAWRCASLASLALAGCVVANVAGCGGGGGGTTVPAPRLARATILLLNQSGLGINGTVTLGDRTLTTTSFRAVFDNLRPGTYPLVFTAGGVTTRTSIVVSAESAQTFVAVPGLSNVSSNGIRVSGRTLLNSPADSVTAACNTSSIPVTGSLLIRVRSLNLPGQPIVSSVIRAPNNDGRYIIFTIPSPGTYRVEARSPDATGAPFAGASASFRVLAGQTETNLDICTNQSATQPGGTPPPPPGTPTAIPGTGTPGVTPIVPGTPVATQTPGGPTATPEPTQTPGGPTATPGPTSTPGGVPTEAPDATPVNTPTSTPLPTNTPGGPLPTATPTATTAGTAPTAVPTTGPPGQPATRSRR